MGSEGILHAYLISFPGQGHVNPLLRLGKRLASKGLFVTFTVPENLGHEMQIANKIVEGQANRVGDGYLRFEFFEDGLGPEDGPKRQNMDIYLPHLELVGKDIISRMINKSAEEGLPVSCIINNPFIPWVSDVAESLGIPNAMLWVQSCACFAAYYHYYHNMIPFPTESEPELDVQIPHMPLLKYDEIPSFLHPTTPYLFLKRPILGQYRNLEKPFCVLMDTFDELEQEVIEYMSGFCPIKAVGPLFKDPKGSNDAVRADFVKAADDCIEWVDTKSPSSVVYISFGSIVHLKQGQVREIAYGLLNSGVSFLWVFKPPHPDFGFEPVALPDDFLEKAGEKGKVVQWCPQEQVLAHPNVACFVTHCGWNSTMEALASGTPVVAFPQWGDQVTDAKYLVDVFKVGLRLSRGEAEKSLITRDEIEKCLLEATSGPKASELKENALKWKKAAEDAIAEGGSSEKNLEEFVEEIRKKSVEMAFKARSETLKNKTIQETFLV